MPGIICKNCGSELEISKYDFWGKKFPKICPCCKQDPMVEKKKSGEVSEVGQTTDDSEKKNFKAEGFEGKKRKKPDYYAFKG